MLFKQIPQSLWRSWIFYLISIILFIVLRVPIFLFSDAAIYHEEYTRGQIALEILQHGLSNQAFLFADDYAIGSFISGLWICPFFMLFGHTLLALKIAALVFSIAALILWIRLFSIAIDVDTGRIMGLLLIFSPAMVQRFQLINMGFHSESFLFLPLTFLIALCLMREKVPTFKVVGAGFLFGLFTAYCVINLIGVILTFFTLFFYFFRSRRIRETLYLLLGSAVGISPWIWLKLLNYNGKIFTMIHTSENSISSIVENLYNLFFIYFPQTLIPFTAKPHSSIIYFIIFIFLLFYILAFFTWRKGLLQKWLLLYPLIFISFYLMINPSIPIFWNTNPNYIRLFIPLAYVSLGIYAVVFSQIKNLSVRLKSMYVSFYFIPSIVFMANLWINISTLFPLYHTAYDKEPGYIPAYRNFSVVVRFLGARPDIKPSEGLLKLKGLLKNLHPSATVDSQLPYVVGDYMGRYISEWGKQPENLVALNNFISDFDANIKDLFLQGLGSGCIHSDVILSEGIDFNALYRTLSADEWRSFNIGLINGFFILKNPIELWNILQQWGKVNNVPVFLPDLRAQAPIENYIDQISLLGFPFIFTPGAIRGYIHKYNKDPVSLKLLGWWLAREMAPDKEWLYLKLGPDFSDCETYIFEGIDAFKNGLTFTEVIFPVPLQIYSNTKVNVLTKKEIHKKIIWAPLKTVYPCGGLQKCFIEECNIILKRGWR